MTCSFVILVITTPALASETNTDKAARTSEAGFIFIFSLFRPDLHGELWLVANWGGCIVVKE